MIYLAFDFKTQLTKIGFSDSPQIREKTLQTAAPTLRIIFTAEGTKTTEKELHKRYKDYHVILEWFALDKATIKAIITDFEDKSSIISWELIEKITIENKELTVERLAAYFGKLEARILELFMEVQDSYDLSYLANNLFISVPQVLKILNRLQKDKILKYKKKKQVEIDVNWNLVRYYINSDI
jgi:Mn-dependent DtxR family transcriptional regulator